MNDINTPPHVHRHMTSLLDKYPRLVSCRESILAAYSCLERCVEVERVIYLCGNGGSAADADHWAGELLKGFASKRPLAKEDRDLLPDDLAQGLQWAIRAIPLTGFPAFATAFANDVEPRFVFAQLVWALGRPGDVLVGMSTSGNSANIVHAAHTARNRGMKVIGLTGENGGRLAESVDICIAVPELKTPCVQELHLPVYHALSLMLEERFEPSAD